MADVKVNDNIAVENHSYVRGNQAGPVWISRNIGYFFFISTDLDLYYTKTTDGGSTWNTPILVEVGIISDFAVWFDKWTPNDVGNKIHICYADFTDSTTLTFFYKSLDTVNDSLSGEITIQTAVIPTVSTVWIDLYTATSNHGAVSITKSRGGNLYAACKAHIEGSPDVEVEIFERSTDDGANWAARTSPFESAPADNIILLPANTSDNQDIAGLYFDFSANAQSLKMYDDSANSWTETAIATRLVIGQVWNISAAVRHSDGHIIVAFENDGDISTCDLVVYDLTVTSISSPTITAKTNVWSNISERQDCSIFIDQKTDDIYVVFLAGGVWQATVNVFYQKSTDGCTTWGSQQLYDEDSQDDHRRVCVGNGAFGGRFYPIWFNDDFNEWYGNFNHSIEIGYKDLDGDIIGAATVTGDLTVTPTNIQLAGAITGGSSVFGNIRLITRIEGDISGSAVVFGELTTGNIPLDGDIVGSAIVTGALSGKILIAGGITGSAIVEGNLSLKQQTQVKILTLVIYP